MSLTEKLCDFLRAISLWFTNSNPALPEPEQSTEETLQEQDEEVEVVDEPEEESVNVAKRTLTTKLYTLEQEIAVLQQDFPKEYNAFMERMETLRKNYQSSLEEIRKPLTFEIDPEQDYSKIGEVDRLESDIRRFLESEVKFEIISKRLQQLITKLNILYNVSIFHSEDDEKRKVMSQLEHARELEIKLAHEVKECDYILRDTQLKERMVSLISYADYQIYKASIRNSREMPETLIQKMVMLEEFDEFNYTVALKAFMKDEISDLAELLPLVAYGECRKVLQKSVNKLFTKLTYPKEAENPLLDIAFWKSLFEFELSLFGILKTSGVEKEKIKVMLIRRMNISVKESDVLVLPLTNAYLSLITLFSTTQNEKIWILLKFLKNMSNNITYKEIYFLLLLFDVMEVVENTPNELARYMEQYLKKYPYNQITLMERKKQVINSSKKEYLFAFELEEYNEQVIHTFEKLNMDYKVINNSIWLNAFYFNSLDNVLNSLKNIMI